MRSASGSLTCSVDAFGERGPRRSWGPRPISWRYGWDNRTCAPDCFAHVNIGTGLIASLSMSLNPNNQFSVPLMIPNNPVFLATNFHAQTTKLLPGVNALGVQTSNGLCVNVGN
ncbi:MAG: hypothetical protein ACI89X_004585 [Planctomycetota bacterium]|jgi:hypothetical protein